MHHSRSPPTALLHAQARARARVRVRVKARVRVGIRIRVRVRVRGSMRHSTALLHAQVGFVRRAYPYP